MDYLNGRPFFTKEQIEKELKKVVLLDRILAERGALTLEQLYDVVREVGKVSFLFHSFRLVPL